jgi:DNA-binding response OmpR family regulator
MNDRRVLIVESNAELASAYRGALQSTGLTVDVLSDVDQMTKQPGAKPPDLLVLDADPSVGDAVCRTVKKKGQKTPVVLVSANANGKRSLFGAHPDVVLQKPVTVDVLLHNVARLLGIELRKPSEEEIPLDENLLEIVEEARPKDSAFAQRQASPPADAAGKPAPAPSKPSGEKKKELEDLRENLKKRPAQSKPDASAQQQNDRIVELEAEREKLRASVEELRVRAETEAAARGKEVLELKAVVAQREDALTALKNQTKPSPELEERARKAVEERDKVWAELVEVVPRAEAAGALAAELEALRAALSQREEQLRERDGRLAERDALLVDKERKASEIETQLRKAEEVAQAAQAAAQAAQAARATEEAKAAERAVSPVFARERELIDARRTINERDKDLLNLRGEIEARERTILDRQHETLEARRKAAEQTEELLRVEQSLVAANEKIAEREREIERLGKVFAAHQEEREKERQRAVETLAAAGVTHEQATTELRRVHADEIAALHESEAAERAELEARMAARIEAMRNQAKEQLAAAEGRRQADLGEADSRRLADLAAADEVKKRELTDQAARSSAERQSLAAAHEQRLSELIREYERKLSEQEEIFRDVKLGMKQRHTTETEELEAKHAARVAEFDARIEELATTLAGTLDDLREARDKIGMDRRRSERAQKALAVALKLLQEHEKLPEESST